jgi:hypothetical protein
MEAPDPMRIIVWTGSRDALLLLQKARRQVEVSAGMLVRDPSPTVRTDDNLRTWERFRTDVWAGYQVVNNTPDTVAERLEEQIEAICRHVVERQFGKNRRTGLKAVLGWLGL